MRVSCLTNFFNYVHLLVGMGMIVPAHGSLASTSMPTVARPTWIFENGRNRDHRFQEFYESINDIKEVELDKRIAIAVRQEPFAIVQFFLTGYVLVNYYLDPIIPQELKLMANLNNFLTEIISHFLEIFMRLQIPADLTNQSGIFIEPDIITDARTNMMQIVGARDGQQIAYSLICILNGSPRGSVVPLLIRDFPLYLKNVGTAIVVCFPNFAKSKTLISLFDNLFRIRDDKEEGDNSTTSSDKNSDNKFSESTDASNIESNNEITKSNMVFSMKNSRVLIDLIGESLSLVLETLILVGFVTNIPKSGKEKINLLVIVKYLFSTLLTLQYMSIRGKHFGNYLSYVFRSTKELENVQTGLRANLKFLQNLSPESVLQLFNKEKTKSKKVKTAVKKKKTVKSKTVVKKKLREGADLVATTPEELES